MRYEDGWYLYKAKKGTFIQHVNSKWRKSNCPICNKELEFEEYESNCCKLLYKIGWGNIRINIPFNNENNQRYGWSYTKKISNEDIKKWYKNLELD